VLSQGPFALQRSSRRALVCRANRAKTKKLLKVRWVTKYRGIKICAPRRRGILRRAGRQYSFARFGRKGCTAREPESCFWPRIWANRASSQMGRFGR
jgi:hypothetical protein